MKASGKPLMPRQKAEHTVTLAAALLVLLGGLLAIAAWRRTAAAPMPRPAPMPAPAPAFTPAPGPLSGLTILIDPGHGGYDGGARCRDSGTWEKHINLSVALQTEQALRQQGAQVVMTRRTDADLCEAERPAGLTKKRQDMQNRIRIAREAQADLVLSIHMNEYRARTESGPQVFYRAGCDSGRLLAGCMQQALIGHLQPQRQRAAMAGDYFILQLDIPSVLIECGFLSNPREEALLLTEEYQQRLGTAIAAGVVDYCRLAAAQ
ncbi:MAG: N-acetylmuramoyl-L-alanine amidase [Clostridia bacterium]|nr:N-acetylmuramoyl-L-alanine amidase [Clostridia bacterium]